MKIYKVLAMAAMLASGMTLTSCGNDFLESLPTDRLADGGTATEASINSGLAAVYQILLFDSYANNNYESNCVICRCSRPMVSTLSRVHGTSIPQVSLVPTR